MTKGWENLSLEKSLRKLHLFSLGKTRLREHLPPCIRGRDSKNMDSMVLNVSKIHPYRILDLDYSFGKKIWTR